MKIIKNNKGVETLIFAETFEFEAYDQIKKRTYPFTETLRG